MRCQRVFLWLQIGEGGTQEFVQNTTTTITIKKTLIKGKVFFAGKGIMHCLVGGS